MSRPPERFVAQRRPRIRGAIAVAAGVLGVAIALSGCTPSNTPGPTSSTATLSASATVSASPTPTPTPTPELIPDGTAADNLPLFTAVTASVWASSGKAAGRSYIDALVAAGFDKTAMEVTQDKSTVGNPAESIQFSVHWGDECLVGQVGPATGAPVAVVLPVLGDGRCLVGETRPIDW